MARTLVNTIDIGVLNTDIAALEASDIVLTTEIATKDVKNAIINGALDFWQRGTNVNALSAYGPDRFEGNSASGFFSREWSGNYSSISDAGFEWAVYAEQGAGGGSINQKIESVNMKEFDIGQEVTFSVWAASATVDATGVMITLRTPDVIDDYSASTAITLNPGGGTDYDTGLYLGDIVDRSVEMRKFSYTFTVTADMHRGLQIGLRGDLRVNGTLAWLANTVMFTGFMLIKTSHGEVPFQRAGENYKAEQELCFRYYRPFKGGASSMYVSVIGYAFSTDRLLWSETGGIYSMRDTNPLITHKDGTDITPSNPVGGRLQRLDVAGTTGSFVITNISANINSSGNNGNLFISGTTFTTQRLYAVNIEASVYANAEL